MESYLYNILTHFASVDNVVSCIKSDSDLSNFIFAEPHLYYKNKEKITSIFVRSAICTAGSITKAADFCSISEETIKKTRNGTRIPSKELWIKFGMLLGVPNGLIDVYMKVAGYSLNSAFLPDAIYYYGMNANLSVKKVYELLMYYDCKEDAKRFYKK